MDKNGLFNYRTFATMGVERLISKVMHESSSLEVDARGRVLGLRTGDFYGAMVRAEKTAHHRGRAQNSYGSTKQG